MNDQKKIALAKIASIISSFTIKEMEAFFPLLQSRFESPAQAEAFWATLNVWWGYGQAHRMSLVEDGKFSFSFVDVKGRKINAIKIVRAVLDLGLKESKDAVDNCLEGERGFLNLTKEECDRFVHEIEKEGRDSGTGREMMEYMISPIDGCFPAVAENVTLDQIVGAEKEDFMTALGKI